MADRDVAYVPEREEEVDRLLNVREKVDWVMHADNQRALFDEFYRTVVPSQSLVFFYAKHTPLAEDPQRVLVGAALVKQVRLPGSYASDGTEAFGSMPWETTVHHTLRPDQTGGILLPYRRLLAAADADPSLTLDDGVAHAPAEAWAQFSYVTEHVSSDTAIAALLARGRGAGLIVLAATQKPAHDIIPTALRDLFGFRWALWCMTPQASDTVLGASWASLGYTASDIDAAQRGVGWLLHEGGQPLRLRCHYLDDDQLADLAQHAEALRRQPNAAAPTAVAHPVESP